MNREAIEELAARMKDRAMTCPRGGLTKEGMTIASVCSDLDKFADELRAIAALEAGRSGEAELSLPCDVRLPPATTINAGCKLSTLLHAMECREEAGVVHFPPKAAPAAAGGGEVSRFLVAAQGACEAAFILISLWALAEGEHGLAAFNVAWACYLKLDRTKGNRS